MRTDEDEQERARGDRRRGCRRPRVVVVAPSSILRRQRAPLRSPRSHALAPGGGGVVGGAGGALCGHGGGG